MLATLGFVTVGSLFAAIVSGRLTPLVAPDGWARVAFEVEDTGIGIPEDEIERALLMNPDPFVEAFCHFIIGMSLEAQGRENSYERQMESSIELVPPEFVAMTSHSGARDKSAWKKFGKEKKERKARLKGA